MKKLILGKGKVSSIICDKNSIVLDKSECDISDVRKLEKLINLHQPEVVINCAAKTNLEYCEDNKTESFNSNTMGVLNILDVCSKKDIKLVHISSGCLFDGNQKVSTENSIPTPAVWYTWTKTWADQIIENFGYKNFLILRPRQLISKKPHPTNMITKFSKMSKISAIEEANSLTCIEDLKEMIAHLLKKGETGIFNCCNSGLVSPHEIALRIKNTINPNLIVEKVSYEELLGTLPNRRVNTILSCEKLESTGYFPRKAIDALDWCLENYGK